MEALDPRAHGFVAIKARMCTWTHGCICALPPPSDKCLRRRRARGQACGAHTRPAAVSGEEPSAPGMGRRPLLPAPQLPLLKKSGDSTPWPAGEALSCFECARRLARKRTRPRTGWDAADGRGKRRGPRRPRSCRGCQGKAPGARLCAASARLRVRPGPLPPRLPPVSCFLAVFIYAHFQRHLGGRGCSE